MRIAISHFTVNSVISYFTVNSKNGISQILCRHFELNEAQST